MEYVLIGVIALTAVCIFAIHINAAKWHKQHRKAMSELREQHRNDDA